MATNKIGRFSDRVDLGTLRKFRERVVDDFFTLVAGDKKLQPDDDVPSGLPGAIEFAYRNDIWPSARNVAILMGYKRPKLNGRMNRERKRIIHETYDL